MYQVMCARARRATLQDRDIDADPLVMQKLFGIVVIVVLIWLGISIFTNGVQATFSWLPWADKNAPAEASPLERFRAKGESARDAAEQRVARQLGEESTSHDEE